MTIEDLTKKIKSQKKILILGYPNSGKTTLSQKFSGWEVIHTDDYMRFEWETQPERLLSLAQPKPRHIVEGVQAYRMLRRGLTHGVYRPEVIIMCKTTRPPEKKHLAMRKALDKIFSDCLAIIRKRHPEIQIIDYWN